MVIFLMNTCCGWHRLPNVDYLNTGDLTLLFKEMEEKVVSAEPMPSFPQLE